MGSHGSKSRRFVFTLNNYTEEEENNVATLFDSDRIIYGVYGRERGESGTPHLQGFCILSAPQRFSFLKNQISNRVHLEVARAKSKAAADYCKKEGDYEEYGELPDNQGKRNDFELFKEWVEAQSSRPSERDIARAFPALFVRYRTNLLQLAEHLGPRPEFGRVGDNLRPWQRELEEEIDEPPDDRSIEFIIDPEGAKGKSWMVRYLVSKMPDDVQVLSVGKRDDLAHCIDATKRIFLFDIPRGSMEFLQQTVLEKLKDQIIFSGKYESQTKFLPNPVHVIVFANEEPPMILTADRYKIKNI